MALSEQHIHDTYRNSLKALGGCFVSQPSEKCLSSRVIEHYSAFEKQKHFSKKGSTTGQAFEMIFTESLAVMGVALVRQKVHIKHEQTNVEVDVFVVGAKRPIIILLKASLRERWKQEDRDAMTIKSNAKGCADALYEQVGLGKFDSAYPPIVWAITYREHDYWSAERSVAHAKAIGKKCTGVDTDRFVSVFDKERMDFLVEECKEAQ